MLAQDRTVRLFVSSTFSDMKAEPFDSAQGRCDALQKDVLPRLKQLCLSRGVHFLDSDYLPGSET